MRYLGEKGVLSNVILADEVIDVGLQFLDDTLEQWPGRYIVHPPETMIHPAAYPVDKQEQKLLPFVFDGIAVDRHLIAIAIKRKANVFEVIDNTSYRLVGSDYVLVQLLFHNH
jgi:hypothetical protein